MENSRVSESDVERARIAAEYELWESVFMKQHGITAAEIAETVKWYRERREWLQSLKRGSSLATIGFIASTILLLLWEGFKLVIRKETL